MGTVVTVDNGRRWWRHADKCDMSDGGARKKTGDVASMTGPQ